MELQSYQGEPISPRREIGPLSMKERLELQKVELTDKLTRVNATLDALNAHPEVMKVLELLSKV